MVYGGADLREKFMNMSVCSIRCHQRKGVVVVGCPT